MLFYAIALPFYSVPVRFTACHSFSNAYLRQSFPLPDKSGRLFAIAFLNLSSRHCSLTNHVISFPLRFSALLYLPWQFLTSLRLCTASLLQRFTLLLFTFALPCFAIA
nr:MAG TPA: hypothetical protein [Caudoviricetes sp.]